MSTHLYRLRHNQCEARGRRSPEISFVGAHVFPTQMTALIWVWAGGRGGGRHTQDCRRDAGPPQHGGAPPFAGSPGAPAPDGEACLRTGGGSPAGVWLTRGPRGAPQCGGGVQGARLRGASSVARLAPCAPPSSFNFAPSLEVLRCDRRGRSVRHSFRATPTLTTPTTTFNPSIPAGAARIALSTVAGN